MYNEKSYLAISAIPNTIWKKFKMRLSPTGYYVWIDGPSEFSIVCASVVCSYPSIDSFTLSMMNSFIEFSLKGKTTHTYINS